MVSLITELRCNRFEDIIGNDSIKYILQEIIKDPVNKPHNIIFAGSHGNNKTTFARLLAKALNNYNEDVSEYLIEVDSSKVSKVEDMRSLLPYISLPTNKHYKVVIFDEAHLISKIAFSSLLKLIEENTRNLFFIFCTTDIGKMLDTIKSRSITLYVEDLTREYTEQYLKGLPDKYFNKKYIEDTSLIDLMYMQSKGHFRDLIQQIELLNVQGSEMYKSTIPNYKDLYYSIIEGNKDSKQRILNLPLILIEDSWDFFVKTYDIPLDVITTHLQYRDKLHTTSDWFLFFNLLGKKDSKSIGVSKIRR